MYKRRKVFSKIGEKTFSTTEFQTQKEFAAKKESAKKEESKKEKVAKAATIGGATVGLGAGAAGLGAEIGRKKVKKGIAKAEKELVTAGGGIKARKATSKAIDKMKKSEKILEKVSKKGTKAGIAGVGASVAGAVAYKALKKKKDQKEFAEKKEDDKKESKKISKSDKANIWIAKNLTTKKDREAAIKAYDKDSKDFGPLAKRTAVGAGIGGGIVGAGLGAVAGPELIGKTSKHVKKKMAAGGAAGALGFGALSAGSAYAGSKLGGKLVNKIRSKSEKADKKYQKTADINKVASGKMTKEEFAEKYGK